MTTRKAPKKKTAEKAKSRPLETVKQDDAPLPPVQLSFDPDAGIDPMDFPTWPRKTTKKEARDLKDSPVFFVLERVALLHEKMIENWDPDGEDEIPETVEAGKPRPLRDDEKEAEYNAARLYQFIELVEAAQRTGSAPCGALGVSLDFFRVVFGEVLEGRAWDEVLLMPQRGELTTTARELGAAAMLERWKQQPSELEHLKPEMDEVMLRKSGRKSRPFDRAAAAAGFMHDRSLTFASAAGTKQNKSGTRRRSNKL